jgi:hypothetical protein
MNNIRALIEAAFVLMAPFRFKHIEDKPGGLWKIYKHIR